MISRVILLLIVCLAGCSFKPVNKSEKVSEGEKVRLYQEELLLKKMELKESWNRFLEEGKKIVTQD